MNIFGLNKLTLLDYPGITACTVFTGGCNFRCPFCHNAMLVLDYKKQEILQQEEIFEFLYKRKNLLEGICITGGEPTLNEDIIEFIKKIKEIGYKVKLDTNGSKPEIIKEITDNKLVDYIAMDIKNSLENYGITIGISNYNTQAIEKSADILINSDIIYEFRTTVVKEYHNEIDFVNISKWLSGSKAYFLQKFVDSGELIEKNLNACSDKVIKEYLNIIKPHFEICGLRGVD
jgi:pyruvate formate lyase activating enzyme